MSGKSLFDYLRKSSKSKELGGLSYTKCREATNLTAVTAIIKPIKHVIIEVTILKMGCGVVVVP